MSVIATLPASSRDIEELNKIFKAERTIELVKARARQRKVAMRLGTERRAVEGLGEQVFEMDGFYHRYLTTVLGRGWDKDKGTLKYLREKECPEAFVRCRGTGRIQVGHGTGITPAVKPTGNKFHKVYPA